MVTAMRDAPTGTWTRTDAPGVGVLASCWMRARTVALRVPRSTRASMATMAAGKYLDVRAGAQRRGHLLGNGEVHVDEVGHTLQRGQFRAFVQVLPGVHIGDADARAKGRSDGLAADDGLGARHLRHRDVARRAGAVQFHFRRGTPLDHALHARQLRFGENALRLQRLQFGLFDRDVEPDQYRSGLDDLSGRELHAPHGAG
jgi:hypothetical protein